MTLVGWGQIALTLALVLLCALPLGRFMARLFGGERTFLSPVLGPVERGFYRLSGVDGREQGWLAYTLSMLAFSAASFALLYAILRLQAFLPLNPQGFEGMAPDLAFNTTASFVANTNWQAYGGETTLGHFAQMAGLAVQNFLSAATGIALAVAVTRAFARSGVATLGNFWVDLTRATLYVLLPLAIVTALAYVALGVPQTLARRGGRDDARRREADHRARPGRLAGGDQAAWHEWRRLLQRQRRPSLRESERALQRAVDLGDAGRLDRHADHVRADGRARRAGLRAGRSDVRVAARRHGHRLLGGNLRQSADHRARLDAAAGNMEGKELRFGQAMTALYVAVTTGLSCGAVNAMHDALTPLGGLVPMVLMQLGEVLPGGVGSGLYGMLVFAILTVFVAGLMVGRTPEFLGKKIEAREMKLSMLAVLVLPLVILGFHGGGGDAARARSPASATPARTACRKSSTPTPRARATTARPSRG
jgi:K+-transporting ATPase ATPase A chain